LNLKELIRSVRRIQFQTQNLSNQKRLGEVSSSFKGFGMSFNEVREYQFGDETRFIDWNVTARYNKPHVKVFEEEREQVNLLMIDVSKSLDYGSKLKTKKDIVTELLATIGFSCALNKDRVGAIFFSDRVECYFEPQVGLKNIWAIATKLMHWESPEKSSNLLNALSFLRSARLKKFRLFILSDFHFDQPEVQREALVKTKKNNRVYIINVGDEAEISMPRFGFYKLVNNETGLVTWHNGFSKRKLDLHEKHFEANKLFWKNECRKSRMHYLEVSNNEDVFKKLNGLIR
jgi:uncharacterized protein (DUF58 family)